VIRGTEDAAIARERARLLVEHIDGAQWVEIERAGHPSTREQPVAITEALQAHLRAAAAT
jgi:pimeloyl-ACP methyl ester carboxylesterase